MLLKLNPGSEVPIYLQLRNQIVVGIASGELRPGENLPPVRQLAADIGINLHTTNKAYSILKSEGFITLKPQKGAVIRDRIIQTEKYLGDLKEQLLPIIAEASCRGLSDGDFQSLCSDIRQSIKKMVQ
jgi:DNA-binding transcriptional regulator YhcF (GntR family)